MSNRAELSEAQTDPWFQAGRFSLNGAKPETIRTLVRKGLLTTGLRLSNEGKLQRHLGRTRG